MCNVILPCRKTTQLCHYPCELIHVTRVSCFLWTVNAFRIDIRQRKALCRQFTGSLQHDGKDLSVGSLQSQLQLCASGIPELGGGRETSQPTYLTPWAGRSVESFLLIQCRMTTPVSTPGLHTHTCAPAHIQKCNAIFLADMNWNLLLNVSFSGTNCIWQNLYLMKMQSLTLFLITNIKIKTK